MCPYLIFKFLQHDDEKTDSRITKLINIFHISYKKFDAIKFKLFK